MGLGFNDDKGDFSLSKAFKTVGAGVAGVAAVTFAFGSFVILDETERGIDYRLGKMTTEDATQLRSQGLTFKTPFLTTVKKVDISLQQAEYTNVETYTKDNQVISAKLTVMYKLPTGNLVNIFKNNPDYETKLERTVLDAAKSALGKQEAQNVAQNREAIMQSVTEETRAQVQKLLGIEVVAVKLPDFVFDDAFEAAVATAANAKAVLNQKQTELEQQRVEKEKTIVRAEADAEATKKSADAAAYANQRQKEADAAGNLALARAQAKGFNEIADSIGRENIQTYLNSEAWKSGGAQMPETLVTGGDTTTLVSPAVKSAQTAAAAKAASPGK